MVADDLRRQADQFIDLTDMRDDIGRTPSERDNRRSERASPDEEDDDEFENA